MDIQKAFELMVERDASDLYLRTKAYPRARVHGEVVQISDAMLTFEQMSGISNLLLANEHRRKMFADRLCAEFIHVEPGLGRFRINIFMQRGTPAIVARHVLTKINSFNELNLPDDVLKYFSEQNTGLCLVCGPAGNGKSTTIASMIEYINQRKSKHIITFEDPIEFLFADKKSLISQREIGLDVPSYPEALRAVTQQSPDIIYIGNIRDYDTMKATVTATELGAFAITTFHTINAVQTIIRILNFFPPHLHDEIRMQLSLILKGSISLRLLPCKDGKGRIPAFETMVVTPTIARLIRENSIREIQNFINDGEMFGMCSFQQSLINLVQQGLVDDKVARSYADSPDDFDLALKGIS